jgi:hypothetical protein
MPICAFTNRIRNAHCGGVKRKKDISILRRALPNQKMEKYGTIYYYCPHNHDRFLLYKQLYNGIIFSDRTGFASFRDKRASIFVEKYKLTKNAVRKSFGRRGRKLKESWLRSAFLACSVCTYIWSAVPSDSNATSRSKISKSAFSIR